MFLKFKKFGLGLILLVFVFGTVSTLFLPQTSLAAMPVTVIESVPDKTNKILDKIKEGLKVAVVNAGTQAVSYFMRKVAYDTAVWLASGGKGQTPFAHTKNFGDYIGNVANEAAGTAIEQLGKPFGLNLCKIPDVRLDLALRLGLQFKYAAPPKPSCTFSDFQKNWFSSDSWKSQYSGQALENRFNASFTMQQSDLGLAMSASEKIDNLILKQTEAEKLQRQEGQGYKPKTTSISGQTLTPAVNIAEEAKKSGPSSQMQQSQQTAGAVISSGVYQVIPSTLSLFLNTLAGTMMKNFMEKGMLPFGAGCIGDKCATPQTDLLSQYEALTSGGRQAAQEMFSSLLVPQTTEIDRYDILANFSNCPDNPGPDNCVADEKLVAGVQEANYGKQLTIAEAIEKNWLHGEWKLIPEQRNADQSDKTCYQRAYCYANAKKLRAARIMPLGFEIAANLSNPDRPWTLKQVVDGFSDCNYLRDAQGNITGIVDDPINKPFCHLIDPNWVLKSPPAKCNAYVYGPSLLGNGGPERMQECVDLTSCVAYDKDGNCSVYGYCAREKNIWKIDADKCDSQNRTCRSFKDSSGQQVSYLYRTLDTGFCNADNVGCSAYSLKKDYSTVTSGAWVGYNKNDINNGDNSVVYFNNKLSSSCSADSAGCTAFDVNGSTKTTYLRKAPYYAGCYDSDPLTSGTQWPKTQADLSKLKPQAECGDYAQACIADEVNCSWYSPVTFPGDSIPGRFTPGQVVNGEITWNDECNSKCVGYAAYREMPSDYSNGQDVAYIIPSSGKKCSSDDNGCTGFTNLSTTSGGLEKVEYYSYLRPCALPDKEKQKTFYTYEGSTIGGYQLKGYILEKDTAGNSDENGQAGGPKYFYKTDADLANHIAECNEADYKAGNVDVDCRQFNDDQGNVYFRLLSKTVAISDKCTPYRLNDSELDANGKCFQNGDLKDGECYYYGLPAGVFNTAGTSKSCSAQANSCREYKGNAGNNIRVVFENNFESSSSSFALKDWSANGLLSGESTRAGEHSLTYTSSGGDYLYKTLELNPDKSYDLTFWAKGSISSTTVKLGDKDMGVVGTGDVWQYFHLGPVELGGSNTDVQLRFYANGKLFLDNVVLKEVKDYVYLVKNSLKVDPACDIDLTDNLPGEALGCAEYKNSDNTSVYLTGFSYLCRENAIGCVALFDTQNTIDDQGPRVHNVWLSGIGGTKASSIIDSKQYSCQVPVGRDGCYVNVIGVALSRIPSGLIVTSTIYIPSDTSSVDPIYLVANQDATCHAVDIGCVNAGRVKQTPNGPVYENVLVKNDPATYDTTLCQNEAVGCNAYSYNEGLMYFKDPVENGQKICTYKSDLQINGQKYSGWFWKDVGVCENDQNKFCSADGDCGTGKCIDKGLKACYPDYQKYGNNFGIWSYGATSTYKNFVGECPSEQNGCTQYVDHNDGDKYYYVIDNANLKSKVAECNGQVSEKNGCILFDQTDQPNKLWDTAASYALSKQKNGKLEKPVSTAANDANIVMKVSRDRECGEWLQCRTSHKQWDQKAGTWKQICDAIGRCDQANGADKTNCANWVNGSSEYSNQVFTEELYRSRDVTWKGMDFDGYTLLGMYPIEELNQINLEGSSAESTGWRLVKEIGCDTDVDAAAVNCSSIPTNTGLEGVSCTNNNEACGHNGIGICVNHVCIKSPDGSTGDTASIMLKSPSQACRAYPDANSPFPNTPFTINSPSYNNANYCNEDSNPSNAQNTGKAYACECDYLRIGYGDNIMQYWSTTNTNALGIKTGPGTDPVATTKGIAEGICSGAANGGERYTCKQDSDCNPKDSNGNSLGSQVCQLKTNQTTFVGWHGFCLDRDASRTLNAEQGNQSCLLWWPVDIINGAKDVNNQNTSAGWEPYTNGSYGEYYCLQARGTGNSQTEIVFTGTDHGGINTAQFVALRDRVSADDVSPLDQGGIRMGDLTQDEIEKVILEVQSRDAEDPPVGTTFEMRMDGTVVKKEIVITGNNAVNPGVNITGPYLGQTNEFISAYGSKNGKNYNSYYISKDNIGKVCAGPNSDDIQCTGMSGNILGLEPGFPLRIGGAVVTNDGDGTLFPLQGDDRLASSPDACPGMGDDNEGGNFNMVRVRFDPVTKHFKGLDMNYCDSSSDDGGITYKIRFILRQPCVQWADTSVISKTIEPNTPDHVAFTNILWANSEANKSNTYKFGNNGEILYATQASPFASLKWSESDINNLVVFKNPQEDPCQPALSDDGWKFSCKYMRPGESDYTYIQQSEAASKTIPATPVIVPENGKSWTCIGGVCQTPHPDFTDDASLPAGSIHWAWDCDSVHTHDDTCDLRAYGCYKGSCLEITGYQDNCTSGSNSFCTSVSVCNTPRSGNECLRVGHSGTGGGTLSYKCNGECTVNPVATQSGLLSLGERQFQNLFARIDNIQTLDNTGDYKKTDTFDITGTDIAGASYNPAVMAPKVLSLGYQVGNDIWKEGAPGISVNKVSFSDQLRLGQGTGNTILSVSPQNVNVEFFFFANPDHMPIRRVVINWDDNNAPIALSGKFLNDRGYLSATCVAPSGSGDLSGTDATCIDSEDRPVLQKNADGTSQVVKCDINNPIACTQISAPACVPESQAKNWSEIFPQTCNLAYFESSNVLNCTTLSPNWHSNDALAEANCPKQDWPYGGCCLFKPRVQVLDNWGWCNGICPGEPGGNGCYNAALNLNSLIAGYGTDECSIASNQAWTTFNHYIVMPPEDINKSGYTSNGGGSETSQQLDLGN